LKSAATFYCISAAMQLINLKLEQHLKNKWKLMFAKYENNMPGKFTTI